MVVTLIDKDSFLKMFLPAQNRFLLYNIGAGDLSSQ